MEAISYFADNATVKYVCKESLNALELLNDMLHQYENANSKIGKLTLHKKRKYVGNLAQLVSQYKTSLESSKDNIVPNNNKQDVSSEKFKVEGVCPMCHLNREEVEILGEQFTQRGQTIAALTEQLGEERCKYQNSLPAVTEWEDSKCFFPLHTAQVAHPVTSSVRHSPSSNLHSSSFTVEEPHKRYAREIKSLITPFNSSVHIAYNLVIFEQFVAQYSLDDQTACYLLRIWLPPHYSNALALGQQDNRWADKEERSNQILALPGVDAIDISFLNDIVPGENEDAFAFCTTYHALFCMVTHRQDLEIGDPRMLRILAGKYEGMDFITRNLLANARTFPEFLYILNDWRKHNAVTSSLTLKEANIPKTNQVCFACRKIGHIKKDCRYRRGNNRRNRKYVGNCDLSDQKNYVASSEVSDYAGNDITHSFMPQRIPSVSIGTISQTENCPIVLEEEVLQTKIITQVAPTVDIGGEYEAFSPVTRKKDLLCMEDGFNLGSSNEPTKLPQNKMNLQDLNSQSCKESAENRPAFCMQKVGNNKINESDHTINFPAKDKPREICVQNDNSVIHPQLPSLPNVSASIKGLLLEKQNKDGDQVCYSKDQFQVSDVSIGNVISPDKVHNFVPEPTINACDYTNDIQVQSFDTVNGFKSWSMGLSTSFPLFTTARCLTSICCQSNILQDLHCPAEGNGFENLFAKRQTSTPRLEKNSGEIDTTQEKQGIVLSAQVWNGKKESNIKPEITIKDYHFWYIFFQTVVLVLRYIFPITQYNLYMDLKPELECLI
ncbi:hypothetical protein XENTR_v10003898 [Xenopus tropicalis]|nr:hypothetical protein XENTR_v10003898 [Xenopus tropicalis]